MGWYEGTKGVFHISFHVSSTYLLLLLPPTFAILLKALKAKDLTKENSFYLAKTRENKGENSHDFKVKFLASSTTILLEESLVG